MRVLSASCVLLVAALQALYVGLFAVDALFHESGGLRISGFVALYATIPFVVFTLPALTLLYWRRDIAALGVAAASALGSVLMWRAM